MYRHKFDEKFKERFFNTYNFSGHDNSKFILLCKGVYQYEYMYDWEKFNEKLLPEKEDFYSCLNMEYITDTDYVHAIKLCKDIEIKNLADIFENVKNICLEIYELDPAKFLSAPGLALQAALKKDQSKIRSFNWY